MSQRTERVCRFPLISLFLGAIIILSACAGRGTVSPEKSISVDKSADGVTSDLPPVVTNPDLLVAAPLNQTGSEGVETPAEAFALDDLLKPKKADDQYEEQVKEIESAPVVNIIEPETVFRGGSMAFGGRAAPKWLVGDKKVNLLEPVGFTTNGKDTYVLDAGARSVFKVDLVKQVLWPIVDLGLIFKGAPGGIFTTKDGSFYVSDTADKKIIKFNSEGQVVQTITAKFNLARPTRIFVNEANGHVFVLDATFSRVVAFNIKGVPIYVIGDRGDVPGRFISPTAFNFFNESLYVVDSVGVRAQKIGLDGVPIIDFGSTSLFAPSAIAVDEFGRVFIADTEDNYIKIYSDGRLLGKYGGTGMKQGQFREITDMVIANDRLYVTEGMNRRIQVFKLLPP